MWSRYHRVRTSPVFTKRWTEFIHLSTSQEQSAPPILFQYVTDIVFKNLIETTFPSKVTKTNQSAPTISTEEEKVIRYAAGYILRTLKRKLQRSSNPLKKHMIAAITDLVGDELNDVDEESTKWVQSVDCGGLVHISNNVFLFFCSIEEALRVHFKLSNTEPLSSGMKSTIMTEIIENDNVVFHRSLVATTEDDDTQQELLKQIVDHWVTIRGFSFARSWMEIFKQSNKKGTQRAKALRKGLN